MTLTPEAAKMRKTLEDCGLFMNWTADGGLRDVSPSDMLRLVMISWHRVDAFIDQLTTILAEERVKVSNLEDEVYDLKNFVYHGVESGV